MTYDEALAYWYARVDFERRVPEGSELKLDRMRELLHRLGDPHDKLRTVHVTGSKGKGSTCAMLASVQRYAGYRVGLFTSPHLTDVRERIQVDGELIPRDDVAALLTEMRPVVDAMADAGNSPTFFEVATALGFLHFLRRGCDIAVIEVGLGGRFDSTNVITPLVSVITSVSLDHTQILGDTVDKIAFEKAGIIKPGVPVVSGVTEDRPRAVIEQVAKERRSPLVQLGTDVTFQIGFPQAHSGGSLPDCMTTIVEVSTCGIDAKRWVSPWLKGPHQAANATIALATLDLLAAAGFPVSDDAMKDGMFSVRWPARMEVISARPKVLLDCAHNVASVTALVETLKYALLPPRRVMIFAVSSDKDVSGMLNVLAPRFRHFYLTRYGNNPRAVAPEELAKLLPPGLSRTVHATPADAWRAACADATPETLVVIAGSIFLAGELRPLLVESADRA